jgi:hypothetical protein
MQAVSYIAERMNRVLHTMRATQGTPYFDRALAAMAALVDIAKKDRDGEAR